MEQGKIGGQSVRKFMVLRETSVSAMEEHGDSRKAKARSNHEKLGKRMLQHGKFTKARARGKDLQIDEGDCPAHGIFFDHGLKRRNAREKTERRFEDIESGGAHPQCLEDWHA